MEIIVPFYSHIIIVPWKCFIILEFMLHQSKYEFRNLQPSRNPSSERVSIEEKNISGREKIYGHFPGDVQEGKLSGDVDRGEDSARLSTDLQVRQKMSHTEPGELHRFSRVRIE